MIYVSVFPSWYCPHFCPYCSVPLDWRKDKFSVPWQQWVEALNKLNGISLDIGGGEPGLYPGLAQLTKNLKHNFAITTSLKPWDKWEDIAPRCKHITCSYHSHLWKNAEEFLSKVRLLSQRADVSVSVVEGYEPVSELRGFRIGINKFDVLPRKGTNKICNAGKVCIAIDPKGDVYRCWGQLIAKLPTLGNLFTGFSLLTESQNCTIECPNCFVEGQYAVKFYAKN